MTRGRQAAVLSFHHGGNVRLLMLSRLMAPGAVPLVVARNPTCLGGRVPGAEEGRVVGGALVLAAGGVAEQVETAGPDRPSAMFAGREGPVGDVAHP